MRGLFPCPLCHASQHRPPRGPKNAGINPIVAAQWAGSDYLPVWHSVVQYGQEQYRWLAVGPQTGFPGAFVGVTQSSQWDPTMQMRERLCSARLS